MRLDSNRTYIHALCTYLYRKPVDIVNMYINRDETKILLSGIRWMRPINFSLFHIHVYILKHSIKYLYHLNECTLNYNYKLTENNTVKSL